VAALTASRGRNALRDEGHGLARAAQEYAMKVQEVILRAISSGRQGAPAAPVLSRKV